MKGYKLEGNKHSLIVLNKTQSIVFDILICTRNKVLYCARFTQTLKDKTANAVIQGDESSTKAAKLILKVTISIHDKSDDAEVQKLEIAMFPLSEERGVVRDSSSEKTDGWIPATTRYGRTIGRKDGAYNPITGTTIKWSDLMATKVDDDDVTEVADSNYYEVLGIDENKVKVLQEFNDSLLDYLNVGAGIGGGFTNTNELLLMGYHEAINGPDGKKWKEEVRTEHGRMVQSGVFERVKHSKLPSGVKVKDTVCVC